MGVSGMVFNTPLIVNKKEPTFFDYSWNNNSDEERTKWINTIMTEIINIKRDVCTTVDNKNNYLQIKPIGLKWVFKIKDSSAYKEILVAIGFLQVPGVYFAESHEPVINYMSLRLLLVLKLVKN